MKHGTASLRLPVLAQDVLLALSHSGETEEMLRLLVPAKQMGATVLAVRPYCHNDHDWQVYFDTNRSIREVGGDANFPAPQQHVFVRSGT